MADNVTVNSITTRTRDRLSNGIHSQVWAPSTFSTCATSSKDMSSGTVQTLFNANTSQLNVRTIANRSLTKWLFVKCGSGASLTDYGIPIPPLTFYTFDFPYDGIVTGILEAADAGATARLQEFS